MTLDAFLAWEERQELRWEFDGFAPVAMTGGSKEREVIGNDLRTLPLVARLGNCMKIRTIRAMEISFLFGAHI